MSPGIIDLLRWTTAIPAPPSSQHQPIASNNRVLVSAGTPKRQASLVAVRIIVPGDPARVLGTLAQAMADRGVESRRLGLNPPDLTADAWLKEQIATAPGLAFVAYLCGHGYRRKITPHAFPRLREGLP